MKHRVWATGLALGLGSLIAVTTSAAGSASGAGLAAGPGTARGAVRSIEFIGMPAPTTPEQKTDVYSAAQAKVTYANGSVRTFPLAYHQLMATGEKVNGQSVGGLFDVNDQPIMDANGQITSDAPDGQSLIQLPGMSADDRTRSRGLALVTQYEYRSLPPVGPQFTAPDYWAKLPATMSLARIDQDKRSGSLQVTHYAPVSFAKVNGLWVPCAGSLSPWNTHLSSEEYEPDAKVREGLPPAADTQDGTDIASFSTFFYGDSTRANPYNYGLVPEVRVTRYGTSSVVMHRALGRAARELIDVQADQRTAYMGDDGAYTGMFMFVADRRADLSAGTLYAAKWHQTSAIGAQGGSADLSWIRLGHATDAQIAAIVDGGIRFSDIFDVSNTDPGDASYTMVHTYMGTEWLRLKPGMEQAAAFLETRRYAAMLGATTEFNKFEGTTHNAADGKVYVVMSRVESGMSDGVGDIQLMTDKAGAVYEIDLASGRNDSSGMPIRSSYVGTSMAAIPELLGVYSSTADAQGNKCATDKVCGGDNIKFSAGMRTLFVGEDTGYRNNNFVWAFNVDTRKLSRILSVPTGAEATGLQAVDDANGFSYIMSNFQHPGEIGSSDPDWAQILPLLDSKWNNRLKTAVGYIGTTTGALPSVGAPGR